jgi:hypothetical protein
MACWKWIGLALLFFAACGGTTVESANPSGGGGSDGGSTDGGASDGDAGYLACMSASGQLYESLKACQSDTDCAIEQEQTDCCGTILYVGVNMASAGLFDSCEAAWVAHFPGCGCASNKTGTEDGKTSTLSGDAGAPQVHCIDFTTSGGVCMTYTP